MQDPSITEEAIVETLREFLEVAIYCEKKGKRKAAITMYYKSLIEAADFLVFTKKGRIPKNHSQRFKLLKRHYRDIYIFASDLFSIYRKTYNRTVTQDELNLVKNGLIEILKKTHLLAYLKEKMKEFEDYYL